MVKSLGVNKKNRDRIVGMKLTDVGGLENCCDLNVNSGGKEEFQNEFEIRKSTLLQDCTQTEWLSIEAPTSA